jgi:hypothetical protein
MPITLPALSTDRRIILRCSVIHRTVVHQIVWPTAQRTGLHSASAAHRNTLRHMFFVVRAEHAKKNWFIDYVLQRIVSSVSVCRRRERLTHVECRMYFLARCHARALHTYAALFCCGPAGCVCIDWVACRLGCICKGKVCGRDLEGGTCSGREAENMGCVVRRVDM